MTLRQKSQSGHFVMFCFGRCQPWKPRITKLGCEGLFGVIFKGVDRVGKPCLGMDAEFITRIWLCVWRQSLGRISKIKEGQTMTAENVEGF